jgi:hypothetical protein
VCRDSKGLEDDLFEMPCEKRPPGLEAAWKLASVRKRKQAGESTSFRKVELDDMDVAVRADAAAQAFEQSRSRVVVEVVEKAVDEDEVVRALARECV